MFSFIILILNIIINQSDGLNKNIELKLILKDNCKLNNNSNTTDNRTEYWTNCINECARLFCKQIKFDLKTRNCTLFYPKPELIQDLNYIDLKIYYILDTYLSYGNKCLSSLACSKKDNLFCINGICSFNNTNTFTVKNYKSSLINQWSFNKTLVDNIQGFNLTSENNKPVLFEFDWFLNRHVLNLDMSYFLIAPVGVYFDQNFTISAWVKVKKITYFSRLFDFANGPSNDNILFSLSEQSSGKLLVEIYNRNAGLNVKSNFYLEFLRWHHLTWVQNVNNATIYVNGTFICSLRSQIANKIVRNNNFIGKSNWANDALTDAYISDLRIFNKSLSLSEVIENMNYNIL